MKEYEDIKKYWIERGKREFDEQGLKPTARDPYLQLLNEYYILKLVKNRDKVLDIGCGEGSSSIKFAEVVNRLIGVDYSETLIEQAKLKSLPNMQFVVGDVLDIKSLFMPDTFDAVISIRCLINLPSEELQYSALENIFFILKPGGILFLSEGYQNGWDGINDHRERNGLDVMNLVSYNKLFDNVTIQNFLLRHGEIEDFIGFGEYLYGSRVAHPLLTSGDVKHDSYINKVFAELQINNIVSRNFQECDYAGIYVVKKR